MVTKVNEDDLLKRTQVPEAITSTLRTMYDDAHELYFRKGGVKDKAEQLEAVQRPYRLRMEQGMMDTARQCEEHANGNPQRTMLLFKAACFHLESAVKTEAEEGGSETVNMNVLLPGWVPAKAAIVALLTAGRSIKATQPVKDKSGADIQVPLYQTLGDVRTEVARIRKSTAGAVQNGGNGEASVQFTRILSAKLAAVLGALAKTLSQQSQDVQDETANILMQAHADVQAKEKAILMSKAVKHAEEQREERGAAEAATGTDDAKARAQRGGSRR